MASRVCRTVTTAAVIPISHSSRASCRVISEVWTVSDKVNAVERVNNGESQVKVSRDLGVSESTLRGWLKDKEKLLFISV